MFIVLIVTVELHAQSLNTTSAGSILFKKDQIVSSGKDFVCFKSSNETLIPNGVGGSCTWSNKYAQDCSPCGGACYLIGQPYFCKLKILDSN